MATIELTINDAIAALLRETRHTWRGTAVVRSENTGQLSDSHGRPDILVTEPNASPVVIETEILPAVNVEKEATERLGKLLHATGKPILSAIAVRLPATLRTKQDLDLKRALADTREIEMALYTGDSKSNCSRWPRSGWIQGSIADLSLLVQSATVPPDVIDTVADELVNGVIAAAGLLDEMAQTYPGAIHKMSEHLHQEDDTQTRRMAATILVNAFMFHGALAGSSGELGQVQSFDELRGADNLTKSAILEAWRTILTINYWPIFDIARRILEVVPVPTSAPLIGILVATAERLLHSQLMLSHDLTGAVFQRLIADRKFLAAFYTTPASAALLTGLVFSPDETPAGGSWADPDAVKALRIADFACGTGTLLSAAYQRVRQLHELAGGNAVEIHPAMMASALVGCDVLPAAAHLTASMLAGAHPTVTYDQSSILTVAYGQQEDGAIALGSLDLLNPQRTFDVLAITAKAAEGLGEAEKDTWLTLPHASFDVVIMNPPFTRATNHEGGHANVPNPMFAAFSSSAEEQRRMSDATKRLAQNTSAHGNAGEASYFLALADRKLKAGGVLALVMPLSLVAGSAWEPTRALLRKDYSDIILISIAGKGSEEMSFSADTGMGECVVIARKTGTTDPRATFVILNERPAYPLIGMNTATLIRWLMAEKRLHRLEDGPTGGTTLHIGDNIGQVLDAPLPDSGGWNMARIADAFLAQSAYQLAIEHRAWLPTMNRADVVNLPMTTVGAIGTIGPVHRDINGTNNDRSIRGPFELNPLQRGDVPTYPILWSHDADRERTIVFDADNEGIPRRGETAQEQATVDKKVELVWKTASHCHANLDFQYNSQSTAMQFTPRKTIGGRAWLSVQLPTPTHEKALVVWANTSLGLLMHWWHSSKQQSGRGIITKTTLHTLPVLDVTALTPEQLKAAETLFDAMSQAPLKPIHELDTDDNRRELDECFSRDVLGLPESIWTLGGPLELLRMKLSQEPSIRGSK